MQGDGYDLWKRDTSKHLTHNVRKTTLAGTAGRIEATNARRQENREEAIRVRRQSFLNSPHAHPPGDPRNPPTARRMALGEAPRAAAAIPIPTHEKGGEEIWNGLRDSLRFSDEARQSMPDRTGCTLQRPGCTGGADAIDHNPPFSRRQTELKRYLVCDGSNHFEVCFKRHAQELYDAPDLVWACKKCNSSKGGDKGLKENLPKFIEPCPGAEACTVPAGGERRL